MILKDFPDSKEFYSKYWGKRPFVVKAFIPSCVFDDLIDGDTLAGLSLEEDIKSRIVMSPKNDNDWVCKHGPFEEEVFSELGEKGWSLLVQNVEQYHENTAELLKYFNFTPRWLLDDIMVSYSAAGGGVGPHMDSYHVFLVQGKGKRKWKLSNDEIKNIDNSDYISDIDLKILKQGFNGEEFEVEMGDVIYIPPHFGHEGVTTEDAMTFSVGFLGLKWQDMMIEYADFLSSTLSGKDRYYGQGLDTESSGFIMNEKAMHNMRTHMIDLINSEEFPKWLAGYFSIPTHCMADDCDIDYDNVSVEELYDMLKSGEFLYRPEHLKISITKQLDGKINIAAYGDVFSVDKKFEFLIDKLNRNEKIYLKDLGSRNTETGEMVRFLRSIYNAGILLSSS